MPTFIPQSWLDKPALDYDRPDITYAQYLRPILLHRLQIIRPSSASSGNSQLYALYSHRVTADRLAKISTSIPKIFILAVDYDIAIKPENSLWLKKCMPEAEYQLWEETGKFSNFP